MTAKLQQRQREELARLERGSMTRSNVAQPLAFHRPITAILAKRLERVRFTAAFARTKTSQTAENSSRVPEASMPAFQTICVSTRN